MDSHKAPRQGVGQCDTLRLFYINDSYLTLDMDRRLGMCYQ